MLWSLLGLLCSAALCPLVAVAIPARSLPLCLSLRHKCLLFQRPCSLEVAVHIQDFPRDCHLLYNSYITMSPQSPGGCSGMGLLRY